MTRRLANSACVRFAEDAESDDWIEGWLVPFNAPYPGDKDSYGTRFSAQTNYCLDLFDDRPLLFHHGLDAATGATPVGRIRSLEVRDKGVWMRGWLDRAGEYFNEITEMVKKGKLFLSSGALDYLVKINARTGDVEQWPICEGSCTPVPSNFFAEITASSFRAHCDAIGIRLDTDALAMMEGEDSQQAANKNKNKNKRPPNGKVVSDASTCVCGGACQCGCHDMSDDGDARSAFRGEWSAATVNDFPDSSFAFISPGGTKDGDGKTTPRSLRHLPYKDASGKPDAAHTRNALARLNQTDIPAEAKASAKRKLMAAAKELGIDVADDGARAAQRTVIADDDHQGKAAAHLGATLHHANQMPIDNDAKAAAHGHAANVARVLGLGMPDVKPWPGETETEHATGKDDQFLGGGDLEESDRARSASRTKNLARRADGDGEDDGDDEDDDQRDGDDDGVLRWEHSFEDIRSDIDRMLNDTGPMASMMWARVVATFPSFVIACLTDGDGDEAYYKIAYTLGDDDEPVLGARTHIDMAYQPMARTAGLQPGPLALDAHNMSKGATSLCTRTKDVVERRRDDMRPLSLGNRIALQEFCRSVRAAADSVDAYVAEAIQMEEQQARAAALASPESRTRQLRILSFYADI